MDTESVIEEDTDIYSILEDNTVRLHLKPGMFSSIKDICRPYDVGCSLDRETLLQLEQEDLVMVLSHRGNIVSKLDLDRIDNECFVHRSIERNILRDFIGVLSPPVILRIESCTLEQKEQCHAKDIRRFFDADEEFHALFFSEILKDHCLPVIEREYSNYKRVHLLALMVDENFAKDSIKEHESIVRAISTRNLDRLMFWSPLYTDRYKAQERWLLKRFLNLFTQSDKESGGMRKSPADLTSDFLLSIRSGGL